MTTKIKAGVIEAGAISTASLADTSITADKLHTTLDLTGKTVTVATATAGDNDTTVASTAFVTTAIANLTDSAPAALDTLNELAAALNDDADFSTTVTNSIALKAPLASPDFTGDATFDTSTLVVDSTNNRVGIGTTSPSNILHISASAPIIRLTDTDTSAYGLVSASATDGSLILEADAGNTVANSDMIFRVDGSEGMRIDSSRNVGIGTTASAGRLDVRKAQSTTAFTSPFLKLFPSSTTNTTGLTTITLGTSPVDNYGVSLSGWRYDTNGTPKFAIKMHNASAAGIDALTVDSSGNVGIGTTSPVQKLNVSGASGSARFSLERSSSNTTGGVGSIQWNALDGHAVAGIVAYGDGNDEGAHIAFNTTSAASSSDVYASTSERMRIDSSGNVGIGTTTPSNYSGAANNLVIAGSGQKGMTIATTDGSQTSIFFADSDSGAGEYAGAINYFHSDDHLDFYTASAERMRIDSSGNLLINGTSKITPYAAKFVTLSMQPDPSQECCPILELVGNRNANPGNQNGMIQFWNKTSTAVEVGRISSIQGSATNSGAFQFQIANAGTLSEAMRIDQSGNVGIGTSSPDVKLHLEDASRVDIKFERTGSETHYIRKDGNFLRFRGHDDNTVLFELKNNTDGSNAASFPNGNLGIGTTTPGHPLTVRATSATNPQLHFETSAYGNAYGTKILVASTNEAGTTSSFYNLYKTTASVNGRSDVQQHLSFVGSSAASDYQYWSTGGSERMRIDGSGKVGIGTTNPSDNHLSISFEDSTTYSGTTAQTGNGIFVNNRHYTSTEGFSQIRLGVSGDSGASYARLVAIEPAQAQSDFAICLRNGSTYFERFRLQGGSGNLVIGGSAGDASRAIIVDPVNNSGEYKGFRFRTGTNNGQPHVGSFWEVHDTTNPELGIKLGSNLYFYMATNGVMSGDFNDTSDRNLKENIVNLEGGLSVINQLQPRTFDWKDQSKGDGHAGFIAQEVEEILPNDVSGTDWYEGLYDTDKPAKAINATAILAHAVKAIQEQQTLIESLEARIAALES